MIELRRATGRPYDWLIVDPLRDPELCTLWNEYIRTCKSKSSTLGAVTSAFNSYERAYIRKRDAALNRKNLPAGRSDDS